MSVADQRHNRDLEILGKFSQRGRKNRICAAEGISGLRVNRSDVTTLRHSLELLHKGGVSRELSLADASDEP